MPGHVALSQADGGQRASDSHEYLAMMDCGRPGGQIRSVPWMAAGRTGTWLATAMTKAPSLNSPIVPSGEVVPQGRPAADGRPPSPGRQPGRSGANRGNRGPPRSSRSCTLRARAARSGTSPASPGPAASPGTRSGPAPVCLENVTSRQDLRPWRQRHHRADSQVLQAQKARARPGLRRRTPGP